MSSKSFFFLLFVFFFWGICALHIGFFTWVDKLLAYVSILPATEPLSQHIFLIFGGFARNFECHAKNVCKLVCLSEFVNLNYHHFNWLSFKLTQLQIWQTNRNWNPFNIMLREFVSMTTIVIRIRWN